MLWKQKDIISFRPGDRKRRVCDRRHDRCGEGGLFSGAGTGVRNVYKKIWCKLKLCLDKNGKLLYNSFCCEGS